MFTGISWLSYLMTAGAALAIYYFYVVTRYYRDDLAGWLANKTSRRPAITEPAQFDAPQNGTVSEIETAHYAESEMMSWNT